MRQKTGISRALPPVCMAILACLPPAVASAEPPPEIRVLVIDSAPSVTVEGRGRVDHEDADLGR
ncbi:MAG TPA: hypothetical protein PLY45_06075, partial [bacterium]|nr:hypothetical protein [bacterium]